MVSRPILTTCCCWGWDLEKGSTAAAFFTIIVSILDFCIGIWGLATLHGLLNELKPNEIENFFPPAIMVFVYLRFFLSLAAIIFAISLLIGINNRYQGKKYIWTWIIGMLVHRGIEIFGGCYALGWLGRHRLSELVFMHSELIILLAYWVFCLIVQLASHLCVVSFWQDLDWDVNGKEKQVMDLLMYADYREQWMIENKAYTMSYAQSQMSMSVAPQHPSSQDFGHGMVHGASRGSRGSRNDAFI
ncbi:unnamed protein product [Owenia fusiformis]|uniref:Uncharacterized protein n=1 Tax=Owenia fusiformis TaxID=6347 RepID=A0A8J1XT72_OWEFU|nr:unnamed protein product [Owenia fusiformis]